MPLLNTDEPVPDHLADTGRNPVVREIPAWRRAVGLLSLIGAAGLTIATALLIFAPADPAPTPPPLAVTLPPTETVLPPTTIPATTEGGDTEGEIINPAAAPTLSPEQAAALLAAPVQLVSAEVGLEVLRNDYNPFTIVPDRPRAEVVQYTVQQGDTIYEIADRFGLKPESIAWANSRDIIGGLRPGRVINILPIDGAYITVTTERTITSIAQEFRVSADTILDSEYNDFFGMTADTLLPSGTQVVIPGGEAEQISWNPTVERTGGDASNGNAGGQISFAPGDPGSCGLTDNPGGGGGWWKPIGSYNFVRGFTSFHTGVDLSAPEGTTVFAANGGTVIFRGWSTWGYGYLIVLAHGPFTTLYGHLSNINVGCGQMVSPGQPIGAVGSTGNSSGPHLHFEIRYNDVPYDPTTTMA
ncbi:MAG: M23 family metallopeptidase, partial [Anaerolinea sp.]|nr:M23 family metallopeptidase [Anaerolinea sp.]